ncbi:unnamed protein product [Toxocara canis]|uniref:Uncharacterized protein n=1 Tax=Toxocara canis TaxID=6265 RepID=A0A183U4Z1_TOXCA|nr:unnamed protein product [Toxocara canis]
MSNNIVQLIVRNSFTVYLTRKKPSWRRSVELRASTTFLLMTEVATHESTSFHGQCELFAEVGNRFECLSQALKVLMSIQCGAQFPYHEHIEMQCAFAVVCPQ